MVAHLAFVRWGMVFLAYQARGSDEGDTVEEETKLVRETLLRGMFSGVSVRNRCCPCAWHEISFNHHVLLVNALADTVGLGLYRASGNRGVGAS